MWQQLRSPEHSSEWTTSLDETQTYDAENMVMKFQFLLTAKSFEYQLIKKVKQRFHLKG